MVVHNKRGLLEIESGVFQIDTFVPERVFGGNGEQFLHVFFYNGIVL